eukprot:10414197-Karenia_brevis.AAC.1
MIKGDMGNSWTLYQAIEMKPEAITMGFSCQPFSRMGAQRGTKDERAGVLRWLLQYIWILGLEWIALEC